jgi:DNA/RNA-binding domain of Phe-tRNA-synthetase-like protein
VGTDPDDGRKNSVMKFRIDTAIFSAFPELHIGIVIGKGVDNRGDCPGIRARIKQTQDEIRKRFQRDTLMECPKIQSWRNAYAFFGAKPKKHRSSVENLYRMTLEGRDLSMINKLVDIYNYVSLKHMIPVGGDDLSLVDGEIGLVFAKGNESFRPLGSDEVHTARKGEVIYADVREVLCRRWNWRESEKTKLTERTRDVLLVSEGLLPVTAEDMEGVVEELARLVGKYCGGTISHDVLSAEKREREL